MFKHMSNAMFNFMQKVVTELGLRTQKSLLVGRLSVVCKRKGLGAPVLAVLDHHAN